MSESNGNDASDGDDAERPDRSDSMVEVEMILECGTKSVLLGNGRFNSEGGKCHRMKSVVQVGRWEHRNPDLTVMTLDAELPYYRDFFARAVIGNVFCHHATKAKLSIPWRVPQITSGVTL